MLALVTHAAWAGTPIQTASPATHWQVGDLRVLRSDAAKLMGEKGKRAMQVPVKKPLMIRPIDDHEDVRVPP